MTERAERLRDEIEAEAIKTASERQRLKVEERLTRARVPKALWDVSMDKIPDRAPHKAMVAKWGRVFLHHYREGMSLPGLLLWGPPGSGKTSIAAGFARYFLTRKRPITTFFQEFRNLYGDMKAQTPYDEVLAPGLTLEDAWRQVDVLVLDDLLANLTDNYGEVGVNIAEQLLRDRVSAGKATIVTSNGAIDTIGRVHSRLAHILLEHCYEVEVSGADYRRAIAKKRLDLNEVEL